MVYAYDPNGNRTTLTDPDGKVTRSTFDALNRTTAVTSAAGVTEYAYLRDGRLKEVHYPNGSTETYAYDAAGNRLTEQATDLTGTPTPARGSPNSPGMTADGAWSSELVSMTTDPRRC